MFVPADECGMKLFRVVCLVVLMSVADSLLAATDFCAVCNKRLSGKIYVLTKLVRKEKIFLCADCAKLDTRCYLCGVPVKDKLTRLADGRLLCEEDAKQVVLEQSDAERIFESVKLDVQSILSRLGALPHRNIHLVLEAKARLDRKGANIISAHDDRSIMGLTRTTKNSAGESDHTIYLLYGLTRERLIVVSAHEYGHAWLNENVRRKLNPNTVEGFCDWLAFKIIQDKNAPHEMKVLLGSDYSAGQLQAFIAAEKEHTFHRVMLWVKDGVDPELDLQQLGRVLVLRESNDTGSQPAFAFAAPAPPRPAPTNLVLKGLSGARTRRFALINDGTFALNEQAKVRLGESNVVLRCVEIRENAVVVQVAGEETTRTLVLGK